MDAGYWVKIEAKRVSPSPRIPHGMLNSSTLHDRNNVRVIGIENAHAIKLKGRNRYSGQMVTWSHKHQTERLSPYEFESADHLLIDFWATVGNQIGEWNREKERDENRDSFKGWLPQTNHQDCQRWVQAPRGWIQGLVWIHGIPWPNLKWPKPTAITDYPRSSSELTDGTRKDIWLKNIQPFKDVKNSFELWHRGSDSRKRDGKASREGYRFQCGAEFMTNWQIYIYKFEVVKMIGSNLTNKTRVKTISKSYSGSISS